MAGSRYTPDRLGDRSPRRSGLDLLDTWLLVGAVCIGALVLLRVVGWIVGVVFFFVKIAIVALVVALVVRMATRRSRR